MLIYVNERASHLVVESSWSRDCGTLPLPKALCILLLVIYIELRTSVTACSSLLQRVPGEEVGVHQKSV